MGVILEYFISLFSRSNNENIIAEYLLQSKHDLLLHN